MSLTGAVAGVFLALAQTQAEAQAQTQSQAPAPAQIQTKAAAPPATPVDEPKDPNAVEGVVVEGRRPLTDKEQREAVYDFVRELSDATVRSELARWEDRVCPGIVGLAPDRGAFVLDRLAQEAALVGVEVEGPGCRPNILIVVTSRPDEIAAGVREHRRKFFAHLSFPRDVAAGGGGQSLGSFLTSTRPVRWWHVAVKTDRKHIVSRATSSKKDDLQRALVIVDARQLQQVNYEQLASYLTLVMLAQLDPEGQPSRLSSIMNLFADREAGRTPAGTLTPWDRAYLKGLYAAEGYSSNLHHQRGRIRRSLWRTAKPGTRYPG